MTYLFIGMIVGVIIGATIGYLFSSLKSAEDEKQRLKKE